MFTVGVLAHDRVQAREVRDGVGAHLALADARLVVEVHLRQAGSRAVAVGVQRNAPPGVKTGAAAGSPVAVTPPISAMWIVSPSATA